MLKELDIRTFIETEYSGESASLKKIRDDIDAQGFDHEELFPSQMQFLQWVCRIHSTRSVLELGTFLGYSTVGFAEVVAATGGKVTTVELDPARSNIARSNVSEAGLAEAVEFLVGDDADCCSELIREKKTFDLVFLDTAETNYPKLYPLCKRLMAPKGLLVIDNVLMPTVDGWNTDNNVISSASNPVLAALREVLAKACSDEQMDPVLLPVGSGLLLSRLKSAVSA